MRQKKKGDLSHAELMMLTIADVIKQLIEAHEQGRDVNLNKLLRGRGDTERKRRNRKLLDTARKSWRRLVHP